MAKMQKKSGPAPAALRERIDRPRELRGSTWQIPFEGQHLYVTVNHDGERVLPGHAYIAPGDAHLVLARSGANYVAHLSDAPPVNRHRPSVDVLFRSAAQNAGKNVLGVILTGMGRDGAQGMLEMQQAGAYTFAQDEASCVVFGMPREAIATGGVSEIAPLSEMTRRVMARLNSMGERTQRV